MLRTVGIVWVRFNVFLSHDPMKYLNDTDMSKDVHLHETTQSFYYVMNRAFLLGLVITSIIAATSYGLSSKGAARSEAKSKLLFKSLLAVGFFALLWLLTMFKTIADTAL